MNKKIVNTIGKIKVGDHPPSTFFINLAIYGIDNYDTERGLEK